jgi:hypothetical protein
MRLLQPPVRAVSCPFRPPGKGEEAAPAEEFEQLALLAIAADEAGEPCRQVVGLAAQGTERRKGRGQVRDDQLEQVLGGFEVLEKVLTQVQQPGPLG